MWKVAQARIGHGECEVLSEELKLAFNQPRGAPSSSFLSGGRGPTPQSVAGLHCNRDLRLAASCSSEAQCITHDFFFDNLKKGYNVPISRH